MFNANFAMKPQNILKLAFHAVKRAQSTNSESALAAEPQRKRLPRRFNPLLGRTARFAKGGCAGPTSNSQWG
jgi:hypothetical protein